jgi:hypothetical protein
MGLFGDSRVPVAPVTEDLQSRVTTATDAITPATEPEALGSDERALLYVRPFADSDGFDAAIDFARDLYRSERTETMDRQSIEAMEWWFTDGQLSQRYCTATPGRFEQDMSARYEHSTVHTPDRVFLDLRPDEYVASAQLHLHQDCAFPIRHQQTTLNTLSTDPYTALASALVGPDDTRALVQCAFMPVKHTWYRRGWYGSWYGSDVDDMAERRKEGTVKGEINPRIVESRTDRLTARDMQAQRGKPAFQTTIRVVVTAPSQRAVRARIADLTGAFEEFTYPSTEQGFDPESLSGNALVETLARTASRDLVPRGRLKCALFGREMVLTADELAGLVHLPNREINAPLLDWERMESGSGAPGASDQFGTDTEIPTGTAPRTPPSQPSTHDSEPDAQHRPDTHSQPAEELDN